MVYYYIIHGGNKMDTIGKRIKIIREKANLNQAEFGTILGVQRAAISKLETGLNQPTEAAITLICKEFNINEVWLRTGEGNMYMILNDTDRFFLNLGKLSTTKNNFIRNIINFLAEEPEKILEIEEIIKKLLTI